MSPNTPAEVDHAYRSLTNRFAAVPVDSVLNLGLLYTLEALARDPDLACVLDTNMSLPPGVNARIVPLADPEPCLQWSLIWRSGDSNPRLTALLRVLAKLSAEEGWLSHDPERQRLLGTSPLPAKQRLAAGLPGATALGVLAGHEQLGASGRKARASRSETHILWAALQQAGEPVSVRSPVRCARIPRR